MVHESLARAGQAPSFSGLQRIARDVDGDIVLVHRQFPNEQLPILVYLAHFSRPTPVIEVYRWLKGNELRIKNPSLALLRLSEKGLVSTIRRGNERLALITDKGRMAVEAYAESLV